MLSQVSGAGSDPEAVVSRPQTGPRGHEKAR